MGDPPVVKSPLGPVRVVTRLAQLLPFTLMLMFQMLTSEGRTWLITDCEHGYTMPGPTSTWPTGQ